MTKSSKNALTPKDAKEILERALWFARQDGFPVPGSEQTPSRWRNSCEARFMTARLEMLHGAVALASYAGDPTLLPLVLDALVECDPMLGEYDRRDHVETFAGAIERLLDLGAPVTDAVCALAEHRLSPIRLALVQGLSAASAEFEPLLRARTDDNDTAVRNAAREALSSLGAPPWWAGLFSRDPAHVIPEQDAARLGPSLARWAEMLNKDFGPRSEDLEELYGILDALPDALASDAVSRLLGSGRGLHEDARLAARLARVPDGIKVVLDLAKNTSTDRYRMRCFLEHYAKCEDARSEAASREIIALIATQPASERNDHLSLAWALYALGHELWPEGCDPSDLVAGVLSEVDPDDSFSFDPLVSAIDHIAAKSPRCFPALREQVIEGWLGILGHKAHRRLHHLRNAILADLPLDHRREVARQSLRSEDDTVATWGLTQLVGSAHDPTRDLPVPELTAQLCQDMRLRTLLIRQSGLVFQNRDLLLGYLHRGELSASTACNLINHLAAPETQMNDAMTGDAWPGENNRLSSLPERAWDHPHLTEADWAAWRRIRDHASNTEENWHFSLLALPLGPLCPEDRAFVDRAIAAFHAGDEHASMGLATVLMVAGTAEDLPLMDALIRHDEDHLFEEFQERMQCRLGRKPQRARGAASAKKKGSDGPKEWMDEDD